MNILFIEDDLIETMKLHRALKKVPGKHLVTEAKNGEEALEILRSQGSIPDIILLDLNMPRMNGIEFLKILKADDRLRYLPAIILTTSQNRVDLIECYRAGIAGYLIKPLKYEDYESRISCLIRYWEMNELVKA